MLLILLELANVSTSVRVPNRALAILLAKFPFTFINCAVWIPSDAKAIKFAIFEIANVKGLINFVDKVALDKLVSVKQPIVSGIFLDLSSNSVRFVVLEIASVLLIWVVRYAKSLLFFCSFEPMRKR